KMKTSVVIQCIVLLACMALCTSLGKCRCVKTSKSVRIALIAQLKLDEPRPHCNRREVIVTLKNGREQCLDPESKFTKELLKKLLSFFWRQSGTGVAKLILQPVFRLNF
uniref:Chemokine interleukin-8-like domain-containing protein n=2 Tax=Oreochromis TaxID=8139 RepID=A0A669EGI0_ORENI